MGSTHAQVAKLLEEYCQLDHEDNIAGIKTRFRYRNVAPVHDGLHPAEILALPDQDLNAIVGLRKLAPYHEATERIRPNYKALAAARASLQASGLYVEKSRRPKEHQRNERQSGSKNKSIAKPSDTAQAGPTARRGAAPRQGRRSAEESADGTVKKKRPGPALRRALKANALSEEARHVPAAAEPPAQPFAKEKSSKRKAERAPQIISEERKQRRLDSYAALTLPGANKKHQKGTPGDDHASTGKKHPCPLEDRGEAMPYHEQRGSPTAGLSKAAKKNMQRARKRQERRSSTSAAGS